MNTQVKQAKQANYTNDIVESIVSDYKKAVLDNGSNNAEVLDTLSKKYGKSVPSIRAKLASLKVYIKSAQTSEGKIKGQKKEQLLEELELLAGEELASLCSATKSDLQTLIAIVKLCKR